ncbi:MULTISPECIES: acyltransferase family protein [unclassified Imperialibacter]|uniref:acyltransferase family protein n=1 Tax=unclassified Imperialibacter TaxID=2629706 RepID=UPI00125C5887|nr:MULTISPECIES: acyltransferase family protein [unclassified Imperialibacter]CAD5251267.1 Acyltransferase [Imperialibacter sp. 89]CAD5284329.1 Acyltransferase [Imperialibacter sp. 75]VVT11092.1 Acyltransferase [Imperialibacter sp. EC-SDR9]
MATTIRRYDIDWLRVIAIGLLLIYHVAIGFQTWGVMVGFITSEKTWESLWIPMSMLNVWRIPLLFFVSGMGVYFALRRRNWKELMLERSGRILVPFLFGMFAIVPIHIYLWKSHYKMTAGYEYNPGHLWFLGNIFIYVLALSPIFFYLKHHEEGEVAKGIKWLFGNPLGLLATLLAFAAEAWLVSPGIYSLYATTWHGFVLGLLAFFFGFCFVLSGQPFLEMILKWKWIFVAMASALFVVRMVVFNQAAPNYLQSIESNFWIFAVFAFGYKYLNQGGKALTYLSQAAYPVYILHMVFLYLGSKFIFQLNVAAPVQFLMVLMFTTLGCFATYEVIRRVKFLRPLFGLKWKSS